MNLRPVFPSDMEWVKKVHEKHYKEEFELPDFLKGYLKTYVIEENGIPITIGGIRPIAEVVIVTDKDFEIWARRQALLEVIEVSKFITQKYGFDSVHAFIQDETWAHHLQNHGFRPTVGKCFVTEV